MKSVFSIKKGEHGQEKLHVCFFLEFIGPPILSLLLMMSDELCPERIQLNFPFDNILPLLHKKQLQPHRSNGKVHVSCALRISDSDEFDQIDCPDFEALKIHSNEHLNTDAEINLWFQCCLRMTIESC